MIDIIISLPWATQRITQILENYDQTSKRSNSGSRRALEELKKGKSSKFDGQNDSQVDSGPVDRRDSIDTRGLYSDIKNSRVGPNQGVLSHFELLSKIKRDIFWGAKDAIRKNQLKKRGQLIRFEHTKALLFEKI